MRIFLKFRFLFLLIPTCSIFMTSLAVAASVEEGRLLYLSNVIDAFHQVRLAEETGNVADALDSYRSKTESIISGFVDGNAPYREKFIEDLTNMVPLLSQQDAFAIQPVFQALSEYCIIRKLEQPGKLFKSAAGMEGPGPLEGGKTVKSKVFELQGTALKKGVFSSSALENGVIIPGLSGGMYISPVLEAPFNFRRAYLSWAANSSEGTHMFVEASFRNAVNGEWSGWYDMGEWPSKICDKGLLRDSYGEVAIDTLKLLVPGNAFRIRLIFDASESENAGPHVRFLSVCLTDHRATSNKESGISEKMDRNEVVLDVPFRSQTWEKPEIAGRICGPTSMSMILQYHGIDRPTEVNAWHAYDRRNRIFGNWSYLAALAGEHGCIATVEHSEGFAAAEREFHAGRPAILSISFKTGELTGAPINSTRGHLIVGAGLSEEGDIRCNDPAAKKVEAGKVIYLREEMKNAWLGHSGIIISVRND